MKRFRILFEKGYWIEIMGDSVRFETGYVRVHGDGLIAEFRDSIGWAESERYIAEGNVYTLNSTGEKQS